MRSLAETQILHARSGADSCARERRRELRDLLRDRGHRNRTPRLHFRHSEPRSPKEFQVASCRRIPVRITMRRDPHEVRAASKAGDFNLRLRCATRSAARAAQPSSIRIFPGFPAVPLGRKPAPSEKSDLARVGTARSPRPRGTCSTAHLKAFAKRAADPRIEHPGLIIAADVSVIRDRIADSSTRISQKFESMKGTLQRVRPHR